MYHRSNKIGLIVLWTVISGKLATSSSCDCSWTNNKSNCGNDDGSLCWCKCCNPDFEPNSEICDILPPAGSGDGNSEDDTKCIFPTNTQADISFNTPIVDNTGFATVHGKLKLVGNQLSDAAGNTIQLQGISSHGIHWFPTCYVKESIQYLVTHWGVNLWRIALYIGENGYATDPSLLAVVKQQVQWCKELGIYVIIDFHVLDPGDPNAWLASGGVTQSHTPESSHANALTFWRTIATLYQNEDHVLYEICNEPNDQKSSNGLTWSTVKEYADRVISAIREIDTETIIIVGSPHWSQDFHLAAEDPVAQPYHVMYTVHFYAGDHAFLLERVRTYSTQIPLFATEWGTSGASGNGGPFLETTQRFLDLFRTGSQVISWAQWSYADKPEVSAALLSGSCAKQDWDATKCSGTYVKNYIKTYAVKVASGTTVSQNVGAGTTSPFSEGYLSTTKEYDNINDTSKATTLNHLTYTLFWGVASVQALLG